MDKSEVRVIKSATAPSLSGQSTLSYQIGYQDDSFWFRIEWNSASGYFSKAWVSMKEIDSLLSTDKPITSRTLLPLFQGKSVNSAGFILAILVHEKLVKLVNSKQRAYERCSPAEFLKEIEDLIKPSKGKKALQSDKEG